MRTSVIGILMLVLLAGCGQEVPADGGDGAAGDGAAGNPGTGEIVCSENAPTTPPECMPPEPAQGELVTPHPGMANVHPVPWESAEPIGDSRLRLTWTSGVDPCYVLDRVEVAETPEQVTITLFEGSDPAAGPDQACIEIALTKAVEVDLDAPLGDRTLVDGAGT